MTVRTTATHPLRIDCIDAGGGRIGMTLCQGKRDRAAMSGWWDGYLDTGLSAIRDWGAGPLLTLVEGRELHALGVRGLGARAQRHGLDDDTTRQWSAHWRSRGVAPFYHRNRLVFAAA